jgi:hypothetical protein
MINIFNHFDEILKEISFEELEKNVIEQKDILYLTYFSAFINLRITIGFMFCDILNAVLNEKSMHLDS